jgi:hypothetical protein
MDARDAGPGLAVSVRAEPRFTRGIDLGAHDADLLEVLPGDVAGGVCRASHRAQLLADADAAPRQADLVALLDAADEDDLRIARRLAQLVVERGYGSRSTPAGQAALDHQIAAMNALVSRIEATGEVRNEHGHHHHRGIDGQSG